MTSRGFTVVEIVVTVTIIGILLVLAFVNLSSSQINARDAERKSDVETIGRHLESYYTSGSDDVLITGAYPNVSMATDVETMKLTLRDADMQSLTAPGAADALETFRPATNAVETVEGVTPQPTTREYVYQPLARSGSTWVLCEDPLECRRFNIYYRLEADDTVYKFSSRNQ